MVQNELHPKWGGARAGGGRPKGSTGAYKEAAEKRTRNIGIRVTEAELAFFKQKSEELGLSLTDLFLAGVKKLD